MTSVFNNLRLQGHGGMGSLTIGDEVRWAPKGGKAATVAASDVARATWSVFGKYAALTLIGAGGDSLMRLEGFARRDREALAADLAKRGVGELSDVEFCSSGVNRGKFRFEGEKCFVVEQTANAEGSAPKRLFDLNLATVSQCVVPAGVGAKAGERKEITMQFVEHDEKSGAPPDEHQLVELRLYVPPGSRAGGAEDDDGDGDDDDDGDGGDGEPEALKVQAAVVRASAVTGATGDRLAEFGGEDGTFLLPRGRYGVELYGTFFRMHGNMYDYKINYSDVERFILLPRNDDVHYAFIVALEKPIRQGQQRYAQLVWQLKKGEKSVDVKLTEDAIAERYGAACGLKPSLDGPLYQLVARVFKVLSGKKVFTTGKYRSSDDRHAVACSVKASTGQLYPLERSFVFVHKPTILIRFEDIASVEFERFSGYGQGSATKNFDLKVSLRALAGDPAREHTFTSIERGEYKNLLEFLTAKGLKIRNLQETAARYEKSAKEAMGIGGSSSDDEPDAYKAKLSSSRGGPEDSHDDEESPDEDYDGGGDLDERESDDDSGSDGSSNSGDDAPPDVDGASGKKKKAKKAEAAAAEKPEKPPPKKKAAAPKKREREAAASPAKKKRKKKDPNAPKGKSSAYIMFGNATRAAVKADHPDFSLGDVGRELGKRWKELDDAAKQPHVDKANEDAARYDREMKAYKEKLAAEGPADDSD